MKGPGRLTVELPLASSPARDTIMFQDPDGDDLWLQSITVLAGSL
jgi:hypothetical protein